MVLLFIHCDNLLFKTSIQIEKTIYDLKLKCF